jgi:hypothetical protein
MKFSCAAAIIIAAVSPRAIAAADLNPGRLDTASPDNTAVDLNPGRLDTAILDAGIPLFGAAKVCRLHCSM